MIVEPIAGNMGVVPGNSEWLLLLRDLTSADGSLLIFDEVISGFRVGAGGAQELLSIEPDLTCLGKVIGGGYPVGGVRRVGCADGAWLRRSARCIRQARCPAIQWRWLPV